MGSTTAHLCLDGLNVGLSLGVDWIFVVIGTRSFPSSRGRTDFLYCTSYL